MGLGQDYLLQCHWCCAWYVSLQSQRSIYSLEDIALSGFICYHSMATVPKNEVRFV
jgi:hypothetical protein